MDQQKSSSAKSKNTIMKFLPRATSSVSFQNPPIYSPSKYYKSHLGVGFSGPMVSMITGDTRRKIKNDDTVVYEPTSPRVSCMGQVKCKYTRDKLQRAGNKPPTGVDKVFRLTSATPERTHNFDNSQEKAPKNESKSKKKLGFKKLFGGVITPGAGGDRRKPDAGKKKSQVPLYLDKAPSVSTMKLFSSGRDKLSDIDWTKAMDPGNRRFDSDEESDDEDHVVIVPSSAPVMIRNPLGFDDKFVRVAGNTEPRKEINLWKRRTMPQPKPLVLHKI